jgi:phage/plasmid-associated DNA primase
METIIQNYYNKGIKSFTFEDIITQPNDKGGFDKKCFGMPNWKEINRYNFPEYCFNHHKGLAVLTGAISNITGFDFDDKEEYNKLINKYPELSSYYTVKTFKGYHIYFKYNKDVKTTTDGLITYGKVDIRNDNAILYAPPTKYKMPNGIFVEYVLLGGDILDIPNYIMEDLKQNNIVKHDKTNKTEEIKTNLNNDVSKNKIEINNDEFKEFADIIDIKYIDNLTDIIKIIYSLRSYNTNLYDLALYICQKSEKFYYGKVEGYKWFNSIWNSHKYDKITIGTFKYYCKISNPIEYNKIIKKYYFNIDDLIKRNSQEEMTKAFYKLYGEDFLYNKGLVYCFNGIFWEKCLSLKIIPPIRRKFTNEFTNLFLDHIQQLLNGNREPEDIEKINEKIKLINGIIKNIQNNNFIKGVVNEAILPYIENNNIEFETKPNIFCFNNKIYDLDVCDFVEPNKEDYMTLSTGYDYREPTEEEILTLENLFKKVFPIEDERTLYLTLLSTGLYGMTLEKFILANGGGRNGKGFTNELMLKTVGAYGYTSSSQLLLNPLKTGSNPELANYNNKRFVIYREPEENINKPLYSSTIKEITGGNEINARLNHSNDTQTILKATHIMEANERPKLSGKINDAILMRIIDQEFKATFTKKEEDIDETNFIYKGDDSVKDPSFQNTHKYALFNILIKYWKNYKDNKNIDSFIPSSIKERTKEYLKNSNAIYSWFIENYEIVNDDTIVLKIEDIYEYFKISDLWNNYSKLEKRELNKKSFIENLSKNPFLRKYYKEKDQRKYIMENYKVKELRNILIGFKKIEINLIENIKENFIEINEL